VQINLTAQRPGIYPVMPRPDAGSKEIAVMPHRLAAAVFIVDKNIEGLFGPASCPWQGKCGRMNLKAFFGNAGQIYPAMFVISNEVSELE
jgi:hypothetical protein